MIVDSLPTVRYTYQNHTLDSTRWQHFVPRQDDIIVTTSYKSGTTWMLEIVHRLIFLDTTPPPNQEYWIDGHWMTQTMEQLIDSFHTLADAADQSQDERQVIFSVETPVNEYYLPRFPICDVRVQPPGHTISPLLRGFVPLYHYLYHEFILLQGGFGTGPDPYHLPIKNAYNWVIGEIPGAVLQPDGLLMNKDSAEVNWAPWQPNIGNHDDAIQMLRATTALRRGPARPFLVFGRMLPPAQVEPIPTVHWQYGGRDHQMAAIFHATWQAPDKRLGWVLANWTATPQTVTLRDGRLPAQVQVHVATQQVETQVCWISDQQLTLELPPVACLLVKTMR
jgi:hypothetical protein